VVPFTHLIWKDQPFSLGVKAKNAFQFLKVFFTTTPFLIHANPTKPFVSETNASNFTLGVILSQHGKDNFLHHVGFHFCKFSPSEINYKIHDIRNFLPSCMLSRSGVIYLKEFNMKLLCI
jgi:hypothetical protein